MKYFMKRLLMKAPEEFRKGRARIKMKTDSPFWAAVRNGTALLSVMIMCSGCALFIGAAVGAGVGVGAIKYVKGEVEGTYAATMGTTWVACQNALKEVGIKIIGSMKEKPNHWMIKGRTEGGDEVKVNLDALSDKVTKVSVRVGRLGDKNLSTRIHSAISRRLGALDTAPSEIASDLELIKNVFEQIKTAHLKEDINLFLSCYSPIYPDLNSKRQATLKNWKKFDFVNLTYNILEKEIGADKANITVQWNMHTVGKDGSILKSKDTFNVVLRKEDGNWKITRIAKVVNQSPATQRK